MVFWYLVSMTFGEQVRKLRKKNGLTLAELAARSGLSVRTLTRTESGIVEPHLQGVLALVRELGETLFLDAGKGWLVRLMAVHTRSPRNKSEDA